MKKVNCRILIFSDGDLYRVRVDYGDAELLPSKIKNPNGLEQPYSQGNDFWASNLEVAIKESLDYINKFKNESKF